MAQTVQLWWFMGMKRAIAHCRVRHKITLAQTLGQATTQHQLQTNLAGIGWDSFRVLIGQAKDIGHPRLVKTVIKRNLCSINYWSLQQVSTKQSQK